MFLAIIAGIFVIATKNAIISVFNLIVLYILVAFYLIYIGITYLGISYIIVVRRLHVCVVYLLKYNQYTHLITASELGERESLGLNLASLLKAEEWIKQPTFLIPRAVFSKVKAGLLEVNFPLVLNVGHNLGCIKIITYLFDMKRLSNKGIYSTNCIINVRKEKSLLPKENERIYILTTGKPASDNRNGFRAIVVPGKYVCTLYGSSNIERRGRIAAYSLLKFREYSTESTIVKSNVFDRLNKLNQESKKFKPIDRTLYSLVCNLDMLKLAYENLKSKPGNITPGITPETLDGISIDTLHKIITELKTEKYQFKSYRKVEIPKSGGGSRKLLIASASSNPSRYQWPRDRSRLLPTAQRLEEARDKLVLEVIRIILEVIFEPRFQDESHGFRPNRSCHTALKLAKQKFQSSIWVIEGDITKCFDNINHKKLMSLIENQIKDRRFTNLIRKSLKAGYFEFKNYFANQTGTPQGSIISPILANIFMNEFDKYILSIKKEFDKGTRSPRTKLFRNIEYRINKSSLVGDTCLIKEIIKERNKMPASDFYDPLYKNIAYVRYADDFIIGVKGSYAEAKEIKKKITLFLNTIDLNLNEEKTKITNINKDRILFLGTYLFRSKHRRYADIVDVGKRKFRKRDSLKIRLEVPLKRIIKKLSETQFMVKGKPSPKYIWMHFNHDQILYLYNGVLRGYANFYSFAHNYNKLISTLILILKGSCTKLLAAKYTLRSQAKVYKKFGTSLRSPSGAEFIKPKYGITLKFNKNISDNIHALYVKE
jgi:group II intron reverse transcriptase/maturase